MGELHLLPVVKQPLHSAHGLRLRLEPAPIRREQCPKSAARRCAAGHGLGHLRLGRCHRRRRRTDLQRLDNRRQRGWRRDARNAGW